MNSGEKIRIKKYILRVPFILLTQNKFKFKQMYCFNLLIQWLLYHERTNETSNFGVNCFIRGLSKLLHGGFFHQTSR
jgi:hypothetical protein